MPVPDAMYHAAERRMAAYADDRPCRACIGLFSPRRCRTGSEVRCNAPLATVVVGGMLIGPIMLLIIVPALRPAS